MTKIRDKRHYRAAAPRWRSHRPLPTRVANIQPLAIVIAMSLALHPQPLLAGAVTDSSWGRTPHSLSGNFVIPEIVGKLVGPNLFHSFQRFSVNSGESATFTTTTGSIQNLISRVSGTEASTINGLLRLQSAAGSAPNFYFVNPNGVTFGTGAQIDVPASIHVSTANNLRFTDGTLFKAGVGPDSTFTSAIPESFGFLGGQTAAIRFANGNLDLDPHNNLTVAAGSIEFDSAQLSSRGGLVRLVAIGAETGHVGLDPQSPTELGGTITIHSSTKRLSLISIHEQGGIQMQGGSIDLNGAYILASTEASDPGPIRLFARDRINFIDSGVFSLATAGAPGHSITVASPGSIDFNNGRGTTAAIQTTTLSNGAAGNILVVGKNISVRGEADISSLSNGAGAAGNIVVVAERHLQVSESASISSRALFGSPRPPVGSVIISAGSLTIDAQNFGLAQISSESGASAAAGDVSVIVRGPLVLRRGGKISTSALELQGLSPSAGTVRVKADSILIEGSEGEGFSTGIFSDGPSGRVFVEAPSITLRGGGISADTFGPGTGGLVSVKADKLVLDGGTISSFAGGAGAGGIVSVKVSGSLSLLNGGTIDTSTISSGAGGDILVDAKNLNVDDAGPSPAVTGIRAISVGPGNGGIIIIASENISLVRGGAITASAYSSGAAGSIIISTENMTVDGQGGALTGLRSAANAESSGQVGKIAILADGNVALLNGGVLSIKNEATAPDLQKSVAKSISVSATRVLIDGGTIEASSASSAPASAIRINATDNVTMQNGAKILTTAQDGDGGPINVAGGKFISMRDSQIATSVLGTSNGNGGNINVSADAMVLQTGFIQANTAAPRATGGDVTLNLGALIPSGNTLFVGTPEVIPFQPSAFGLNVIQAAAPEGVSGDIQITSPQLDLTGSLTGLSAAIIDTSALSRDLCRVGAGSSLTPIGRGGLAPSALDALRPESPSPSTNQRFRVTPSASGTSSLTLPRSPILLGCL